MIWKSTCGQVVLHQNDCLEAMREMGENSVDAIVTDPPYGLEFMGKKWDKLHLNEPFSKAESGGLGGYKHHIRFGKDGRAMQDWHYRWAVEALRVAKPGAHLLAFGGTRTYHRLACAIEDAGWEIKEMLMWVTGQGFPKSLNVERKLREAGYTKEAEQFKGYGTALKPSFEPICLARKPLSEKTVAANVLKWGCGGLAIDKCRVETEANDIPGWHKSGAKGSRGFQESDTFKIRDMSAEEIRERCGSKGRWPAHLVHDGSAEVRECFPVTQPSKGKYVRKTGTEQFLGAMGDGETNTPDGLCDSGSASRFFKCCPPDSLDSPDAVRLFYCGKATKRDRNEGCEGLPTKRATELTGRKEGSKGLSGSVQHGNATNPFANGGSVEPRSNHHCCVKPTSLMQYLCRLITPPSGTVLDPFAGSGSTLKAAIREGFKAIGIEQEQEYFDICVARCKHEQKQRRLL